MLMYMKDKRNEAKPLLIPFIAYAEFAGLSCFFGGIAHQLIDSYGDNVLGLSWDSTYNSFMVPWTLASTLNPPVVFSCFAIVLAFAQLPCWSQCIAYALGALLAMGELVIVITENLASRGLISA